MARGPIKIKHTSGYIAKGLTRDEAQAQAPRPTHDCRGFVYEPKSGKYTWA